MANAPKQDSRWGIGLTIVIVLFMIATLSVVYFTTTKRYDLVTDHHYEKSVKYQDRIDAINRTRKLRPTFTLLYDKQKEEVQLNFPVDNTLKPDSGLVLVYKPDNARNDINLNILTDSLGVMKISTQKFKKGNWKFEVNWWADSLEYYFEKEVFL